MKERIQKLDNISPKEILRGFDIESVVRGRNLEEFTRIFDITMEQLRDKVILDVGSGFSMVAQDFRQKGVKDVYSIDPLEVPKNIVSNLQQGVKEVRKKFVKAVAEAIPFRGETFDFVFAFYSVPYYTKTKEQVAAFLRNFLRVVKNGGEIQIFPIFDCDPSLEKKYPMSVKKTLKKSSYLSWADLKTILLSGSAAPIRQQNIYLKLKNKRPIYHNLIQYTYKRLSFVDTST